ncbi:glycosyltransferase involved in cell wall biosynthesis/MoaA/NifB/PqqE/SkfB family radical SAM enzyme [Lewinella aquimaris]|uniref:Glycosyltransferase involved in cell wall biosynthesis/MoaA/NifB/PqqE/SkfB family radical SAM enzyme n=1 Tax=Neolewinella aquimaris TaxID=1835722 RepID=A0A840E4A9_9BACT|nr:glycosyltransferase [Neolewinella aquimaris]MBB4079910.1 glycosyltransferase involved in cell wall biosynthesis/MoaA/NifB/PqqE/SkfB family radical SAM enzyme [Neolewinella aquimaris]
MNICFFNDIHILGGGELWVLKATQRLENLGHTVHIMCPWRSALYGECLRRQKRLFGFSRGGIVPFYEPIYHYLRKNEIDVLCCTVIGQFNEAEILGAMVARINEDRPANRKMALILKTGLPPMGGLTPEHYGFGAGTRVQRLHVVSERVRQDFLSWQPGEENFIQTVREGVDLAKFSTASIDRTEAKRHWDLKPDGPVVTCLARLSPQKGQDNLLLSVSEIVRVHPDTTFLIAGTGEDEQRLRTLARQLGVGERVRFLGHVEDVPFLLAATDVLCHPSLADGLPNSLVEAMAMGIPVVASRVGGIPDLVEDERSGLIVPPHDIRAIATAVNRLLAEPGLRHQLARQGRERVIERFDLQTNTDHLADLFAAELEYVRTVPAAQQTDGNRRPLNVLFLMNTLRTGGEETEVAILSKYLDRRRYRPTVVSLFATDEGCPAIGTIRAAGVAIDETCHGLATWNEKAGYLVGKIEREDIAIVVACQDARFAHQLFDHLPRERCKLIEHGGIVAEAGVTPKHNTFRYVGVSPAIRNAARRGMANPGHARYLPSMVDLAEYELENRDELRAAYNFGKQEVIVTFVGRLDPKKRVEQLIRSAAELLPRHPELRFLVVGGHDTFQPAYASELRALASSTLPEPDRFLFTGNREDVARILIASDMLVLPATGEGMSHVINEAGAAALAVIATRDGAAAAQLNGGRAGMLYDADNDTALTRAIRTLTLDANLRRDYGDRLRQKAEKDYAAAVVVPQWEALFDEVAAALPSDHDSYIQRFDGLPDFPVEIQIQTSTLCNATCVMCPYPEVSKEYPVGRMEEKLYRKIIEECANEPGLRRIEPFLMNEAFIDKRVPEWIKLAKDKVPHAAVTVTTNGTPLVPSVTDRLIASGIDAIWFSFNGAKPETYEKIMGIPYEKVMHNIEYLLAHKPDHLQVYVNMIETELMADEIAENIENWRRLGVQAGSSPLVNRGGNVTNFSELNYQAISEVPVRSCELVYYKMYILYNGDCILCCMDWRRSVVLGNVYEQSIREIWNGPAYREIRRLHTEGRDGEIPICGNCSYTLN